MKIRSPRKATRHSPSNRPCPTIEPLEDRTLLAAFTVVSAGSGASLNGLSVDYLGTSALGGPAGYDRLTIKNVTDVPIGIKALSVATGFTATLLKGTVPTTSLAISPGQTAFVNVAIDTSVAGSRTGLLKFQFIRTSVTSTWWTNVSANVTGVVPDLVISAFGAAGSSVVAAHTVTGATEGNSTHAKVTSASDFRLYSFHVSAPGNYVQAHLTTTATNADPHPTNPTGNLHLKLFRDTNANGQLDWTDIQAGNAGPINLLNINNGQTVSGDSARVLSRGTYFIELVGEGLNQSSRVSSSFSYTLKLTNTAVSVPFPPTLDGSPPSLPATIEFANFDAGGEGVAYHDSEAANLGNSIYRGSEGVDVSTSTDPLGGGHTVGYVRAGEWLKYSVNVPAGGTYKLDIREAAPLAGGTFHIETETGLNITGPMAVQNTGGWNTWQTVTTNNVVLPAGRHVLKIVFDSSSSNGYVANFNWFQFYGLVA